MREKNAFFQLAIGNHWRFPASQEFLLKCYFLAEMFIFVGNNSSKSIVLKKRIFSTISILLILFLSHAPLPAQISEGGTPESIKYRLNQNHIPEISVMPPDLQQLRAEDDFYRKNGIAIRFAESVPVNINLATEGTWERLPDGSRICRLIIESKNAQALILYYSRFIIPAGGKLFMYNADQRQIIGAFTHRNNPTRESFATEMIQGGRTTLEYIEPAGLIVKPEIVISEVGYVYRTAENFFHTRGFGGSDTCEVNINCPEGKNWQNQKNCVARVIVKSGFSSFWCTGSLVNNVRWDLTPYFFTANHCGTNATPQNYSQWVFYFRYEGPDCENPLSDTLFKTYTMTGATKLASSVGMAVVSDFKLLRLSEPVPDEYHPYFCGWSITGERSPEGVTIHHPDGDIKKISTYTDTLKSTTWSGIPNTHWRVVWSPTETNWGVTEGGSSGSPLFDPNGRIVGQLTGGEASCRFTSKPDYYGKFSYSWDTNATADSTMLRPWLDPDNVGVTFLDGTRVSVEEVSILQQSLQVFPNPTDGVIYIRSVALIGNEVHLKISNVLGLEMFSSTFPNVSEDQLSIDLSLLPKGIYFLTLLINGEKFTAKLLR